MTCGEEKAKIIHKLLSFLWRNYMEAVDEWVFAVYSDDIKREEG